MKITEAGRNEKRKAGGDVGGTVQPWQKRQYGEIVNDPEKIELINQVNDLLHSKFTYKQISEKTGVATGTISNWKKQISDPNSAMCKILLEN